MLKPIASPDEAVLNRSHLNRPCQFLSLFQPITPPAICRTGMYIYAIHPGAGLQIAALNRATYGPALYQMA